MSDKLEHITRDELRANLDAIQAKLDALHNRILLYIGVAVGLIQLNLPSTVTVGAILAMVGKASWVLIFRS